MGFPKKKSDDIVEIKAPNFRIIPVRIVGTSQYVANNFGDEARRMMAADQERGTVDKPGKKKNLPPKDFEKGYRDSMHVSPDGGWLGIPCNAFRQAMIRAGSLCGIEMTKIKQCVFILPDGFGKEGEPLVRIAKGTPERFDAYVINANGSADIRARARVSMGWEATVSIRFDADFMSLSSVINLLHRAGISVGVGAGRPFSTKSAGQGWGTFDIVQEAEKAAE